MKDNPKYYELRRLGFISNFYSTVPFILLVQFNVMLFNLRPLMAGNRSFGLPLYYGIDFDNNAAFYYPLYAVSALSLVLAGSLIMNICTFISSLLNYLTLEFHILGLTYDEVFDENIKDKPLNTVFEELQRNTIQHDLLLM